MSEKKQIMCSCGFPQSSPLPHEHDRTEREKKIIRHYKQRIEKLRIALADIVGVITSNELMPERDGVKMIMWTIDVLYKGN